MESRITIRFTLEEAAELRADAKESGLPVATLIKLKLCQAIDRDRLASALKAENDVRQDELAQRHKEMQILERQLAAIGFIKSIAWEHGKATGIDVNAKEIAARENVRNIFACEGDMQ